jgi:glycosyltransferase involved in cell wall biosynthesis
MHDAYLLRATRRTSFWVILISLFPMTAVLLDAEIIVSTAVLNGFVALQLLAAVIIILVLLYNVRKTAYRQGRTFYADKELPSLSVLIPARNETEDLELCLRSCLASDYPKLEIVVLDDCSHHETSEIVKNFAHDGVRFIKGNEPDTKWLAKNAAYERLRAEASGEILLFSGVDVRFGSHAFRALVTEMLARDKQMVSILPRRFTGSLSHAFVQPLRYWWELALPRKLLNKPAVLSTCWLIQKKKLNKLGGFGAVSRSIIPERYFARELVKTNDYSFIRANDTLDVLTAKSFKAQRDTAVRVKYPQLSKRPEMAVLTVVSQLVILIGPFIGIAIGFFTDNTWVLWTSVASSSLLVLAHITIIHLTNPVNVLAALWNLPYAVAVDIWLTLWSMYKYEFGQVLWKDRNICIPVMHVVPRLPKVD